MLKIFLEAKSDKEGRKWNNPDGEVVDLCAYMEAYWAGDTELSVDGEIGKPIDLLPKVFPGKDNSFASEFVVLEKYVNGMKERVSSLCSQLPG
jgi:hypothetical protein